MQGKKKEQYEAAARNWVIGAAGVLILLILLVLSKVSDGQEVGYLVVIDRDAPTRNVDVEQTVDTAMVNDIFKKAFNLDEFSIVAAMDSTGVFHAENGKVWVYSEERWVVKRRNGKFRYRKMRGNRFTGVFDEADRVFWGKWGSSK